MHAFWIPNDDTYTRRIRKNVGRSVMTERAAQVRKKAHNRDRAIAERQA